MRPTTLIRAVPSQPLPQRGSRIMDGRERAPELPQGVVHSAILACVFLTMALSSIVFSEPAPVDALLAGLCILLPVVGLVVVTPALAAYLALWGIAGACGLVAAALSRDVASSTVFTSVSIYLYVMSFMLAGFVACAPAKHTRILLSGWTVAALIAATTALAGYFDLFPGAHDLFTKFDRASGTFKDPNVFGPFMIAPILYALHLLLERPIGRGVIPLVVTAVLALGVLLSFSRGAWINLVVAVAVYGVLAYATAPSAAARERIVALVAIGAGVTALMVAVALQDDHIGAFFKERASLTQSYDEGPAGRFGGQQKAIALILENPLGIGAQQFTAVHHTEEVHNVYLSMMLNAGWLGGLMFWLMAALTVVIGFRGLRTPSPARPLLLVAFSAFVATAAEGIVIDLDHWRSFYVLMAIVWGIAAAPARETREHAP